MVSLSSKEKYCILSELLRFKDNEIVFTESDYTDIFNNVNIVALENFLNTLSKKGVIEFYTYAEDGFAAEFTISKINRKELENEIAYVKMQIKRTDNKRTQFTIMLLIISLITIMLCYSLFFSPHSLLKEYFSILLSFLLTIIAFLIASTFKKDKDINEVKQYSEKLKRTIIDSNYHTVTEQGKARIVKDNDENDALNLMLVNMEEIKAYYTLSKTQAKDSFRLSVWMCILGFILLVAAVILPFLTSGKYEVSIITAIGGAIVEIIAGTSLFIYKNSLSQLNHYYESLHDNERFLSTVNLVRKLSPEKQDEMYIEIIRSGIKGMNRSEDK